MTVQQLTRSILNKTTAVVFVLTLATSGISRGEIFFSENFDGGGGAASFTGPFFSSETGAIDGLVDYALDYGAFGLPSAPNSSGGTTIGLGIQVNNTDDPIDEGEAVAVSPIIADLPENYVVVADAFIYYAGGSGSSEHAVIGVNSDGSAVPFTFVPAGPGLTYHIPHNSGLSGTSYADDYYRVEGGTVTGLYGNDAVPAVPDPETLTIPFKGEDPIFGDPGYPGNRWFTMTLAVQDGLASLSIEGVLIDQFDVSGQAAGDILLGGADIFNSANASNWILFDNVKVVPEPGALALLCLSLGLVVAARSRG